VITFRCFNARHSLTPPMANSGMHIDPVIDGCELRFRSGTPPYGVDHHGIRATINGSAHPPASRLVPRIDGLPVRRWGTAEDTGGKWYYFEYDYVDCRRQALISGAVRPFRCSKFQVFRVLPEGCSRKARSEHRKGTALAAALRSALEGKLSTDRDAPVLVPHLPETVQRDTS
jgi:hypothetical protein